MDKASPDDHFLCHSLEHRQTMAAPAGAGTPATHTNKDRSRSKSQAPSPRPASRDPDAFLFPHHILGFRSGGKGTSMRDVNFSRPDWGIEKSLAASTSDRWGQGSMARFPAHARFAARGKSRRERGNNSRTRRSCLARDARYRHIRAEAKRVAILALEYPKSLKETSNSAVDSAEATASGAQNWVRSGNGEKRSGLSS
jgi:hypothetical protein